MVRPNFVVYNRPKVKLSMRTIAIGVIVFAAVVLLLGFGLQQPDSPITKLVSKVGKTVGLEIGAGSSIGETSIEGEGSGASDGSSAPASPVPTEGNQGQLSLSLENPLLDPVSADEILRLVNEYRKGKGLPEIVKSDRFCEWAYHRAETISTNWSQDVYQTKRDDIFRAVCAKCKQMGEVLARNVKTPQETVNQWLKAKLTALDYPYNIGCVGGYTTDGVNAYIAFELGERERD